MGPTLLPNLMSLGARTTASLRTGAVWNCVLSRRFTTNGKQNITTLEDLANLKSLNNVDPELIKRLINERTSELNAKDELEMLKNFSKEDELSRESALKKFTRPLWVFLLMSSTIYLAGHFLWWNLEYDEKERELESKVEALEEELRSLLKANSNKAPNAQTDDGQKRKSWYQRWFW